MPRQWFWGQCTVPGPGMAGGLIALCVLLCCAASCACRRCSRRRRRDRQIQNAEARAAILVYQPGQ